MMVKKLFKLLIDYKRCNVLVCNNAQEAVKKFYKPSKVIVVSSAQFLHTARLI